MADARTHTHRAASQDSPCRVAFCICLQPSPRPHAMSLTHTHPTAYTHTHRTAHNRTRFRPRAQPHTHRSAPRDPEHRANNPRRPPGCVRYSLPSSPHVVPLRSPPSTRNGTGQSVDGKALRQRRLEPRPPPAPNTHSDTCRVECSQLTSQSDGAGASCRSAAVHGDGRRASTANTAPSSTPVHRLDPPPSPSHAPQTDASRGAQARTTNARPARPLTCACAAPCPSNPSSAPIGPSRWVAPCLLPCRPSSDA